MANTEPRDSNWGRWGDSDEVGTINLLTSGVVTAATGTVRQGRVISLGRVIRHDIVRVPARPGPTYVLTADAGDYAVGAKSYPGAYVADDFLAMPAATGTHLDGLAHVWSDDGLYNGHDAGNVRSRGAKRCGLEKVMGIVTRGVFADVAKLHDVDRLEPSHVISGEELEAATGDIDVRAGDAVLIRTGWLDDANVAARGMAVIEGEEPGIGRDATRWLAERDVAVVGCDNLGIEVLPPESGKGLPLHVELINRRGTYLIELLDLDELSAAAATDFLFVVAPLRVRGGVNSPVNPLAVL